MAEQNPLPEDKTLSTLCKCRNLLMSKLKDEDKNHVDNNIILCEKLNCDNKFLLNILNKLYLAKENLSPVIEEIIINASKLTTDDYKNINESRVPICSVTTEQFAGAVEASKLLYEINEHLNEVDQKLDTNKIAKNDVTVNALAYHPGTTAITSNVSNVERIFIDRELMQQLIELHDLLGDTIQRLKVSDSGTTGIGSSTKSMSEKSSNKGYCAGCKSKKSVTASKVTPTPSKLDYEKSTGSAIVTHAGISCDTQKCPDVHTCPVLNPPKKRLICCPKKTHSQIELQKAKKKEKAEQKLLKKLEKQKQKEKKAHEKQAKKAAKHSSCCGGTKSHTSVSKSATCVGHGTPSTVGNIDEAKQKIMDCLEELSNIRTFLNKTKPNEIDMDNQLEIVGTLQTSNCCVKNFPHLHATLNGIPIVLQLNKEVLNMLLQKPPSTTSKCKCGPVELNKCPLEDLDYTPTSEKVSQNPLKTSTSKAKSAPSVVSNHSFKKFSSQNLKKPSKEAVSSSAVLWKHPDLLSDVAVTSLTDAEIMTTPQTSITVFSTKKTKDGQKVRLSLTISPMGPDNQMVKVKESAVTYASRNIIPEKESYAQGSKAGFESDESDPKESYDAQDPKESYDARDPKESYAQVPNNGFETDESDPGLPYMADNSSLPDFGLEEQKTKTTLTTTGICHPDCNVQKELKEMGIDNLLKVCRPAKCCRKTVINERPRNALPYPASLMSLPLDEADLNRIKADLKRSNSNYISYQYQTFNFENYTKFQRDDKFPWVIQIYEVRYFEFIKMPGFNNKKPTTKDHKKFEIKSTIFGKNEENKPNIIKDKLPALTWLSNREFNFNIFDIIKRRNLRNAFVQTVTNFDENVNCKIIIPSNTKKTLSQKHRRAGIQEKEKNLEKIKNKSQKETNEICEQNQFPYVHENIACFNVNKEVHFADTKMDENETCKPFDQNTVSTEKSNSKIHEQSNAEKPKTDHKIIKQNKIESHPQKQTKDSMVKLVPLQPYLVEKLNEIKSTTSAKVSNSSIYNPGVDKVDSRIVYKRFQSDDLYYITSETNDISNKNKNKGEYTSLYKNYTFYPMNHQEISAYYNTSVINDNKIELGSRCRKTVDRNNFNQCCCTGKRSQHNPESLEKLMINGVVPCFCSNCSMQNDNIEEDQQISKNNNWHNKLVTVSSNKSLNVLKKNLEKRNKKTIIKSGRKHKEDATNRNTKQIGNNTNSDFKERTVNGHTSMDYPKNKVILTKDAYCTTKESEKYVNQTTSADGKKCTFENDTGISTPFFKNIYKKSFGSSRDITNKKSGIPSQKSSFYFQCEDEDPSNLKMSNVTSSSNQLQFAEKNNELRAAFHNESNQIENNSDVLPIIRKHNLNVNNYAVSKVANDKKNVLRDVDHSNIPIPYNHTRKDEKKTCEANKNMPICYHTESIVSFKQIDMFKRQNTSNKNYKNVTQCHDCYLNTRDSFYTPIKNKNILLQAKSNIQNKTNKSNKTSTKPKSSKQQEIAQFTEMLEKLSEHICHISNDDNIETNNQERKVIHRCSPYNAEIDGEILPGYISFLKPTCGCPEITVFVPCYCDDNTILGKDSNNSSQ